MLAASETHRIEICIPGSSNRKPPYGCYCMKIIRNPFVAASREVWIVKAGAAVGSRRKGVKQRRVALRRGPLLSLAALTLLGSPGAMAADIYWDGSGTGWDTVGSWSTAGGATTPDPGAVPGSADIALFNISTVNTAQTVSLNAAQSALGLSFTSSGTLVLQGGGTNRTLTLAGSGITKSGTGAVTIGSVTTGQQVALALSASQTWANNDNTAALNILNGVAASTATSRTLTLSGTSTASNTISGIIANNGSGVLSLAKSGAGTWLLSGANTYTGTTSISAGLLKLGNASALGSTTGGTTLSGGTLDLNGQSIGAETITFSSTSALLNNSGTAASLSGRISSLRSSSTMGGTGDLTLSGVISSSGTSTTAWSKVGTGKLTLSGANTYSRALTITAGVVNIQHATALGNATGGTTVNAGAALEIQGGITVGAEALTLNGTGLSAAGALHNISGTNIFGGLVRLGSATRINSDAGTLTLSNAGTIAGTYNLTLGGAGNTTINSIIGTGTGNLVMDGTGLLTLGGANTYTGVTTFTDGILSVATIGNGTVAGNLGKATNAAANLVFNGGTLRYTGANATTDRNFTINSGKVATFEVTANNLTISGASPAGTGGLAKTGAGTLTLTASQLYSGATTVSAGTLALGGAGAIADASAVTVSAGTFDISAITASGETIGSLTGAGGSSVVLGAKKLTTGDASDTGFAGVLSGAGGSLTKTGAGTLTLSGSNTYTGGTTLTTGALSVAASSALGLESNILTIGSGATLKAGDSFSTSRATTLGGVGAGVGGTIEVAAGKTLDYTSGSSLSGSGSLIKTGAGTLFLEGTNPFTGGLYIQAGTLAANSQEALGAVPSAGSSLYGLHLYDGATFQIQVGSWATYRQLELLGNLVGSGGVAKVDVSNNFTHQRNGLVTGAGKLDLVGTGTLILTGANTYSGGTLIENGVLQVNNGSSGSATGTGAVTVANGGTLSGLPTAPGYPGMSGSVSGTVTLQSGGRLLAGSGTTLTLGGLSLGGGALGTFQLGSLTATSLVNVTGSNLFTLPGSGISTLDIVNTGAMGVGTYHLFDYAGTALSGISNLALASTHSGLFNLSLVNNTSNTSIDLDVTAITQQWKKGGSNTNWSTAGNWWTSGVPDGVGAAALFLNNNSTAGFGTAEAVTLDGNKTVGSIILQNTGTAFTIGSSGQTLTLDDNGTLATINVLGAPVAANHVISAPLALADNLTVNVAAGTSGLDLGGAISGSGKTLTKTGSGPLTLSGSAANTYSGLTEVAGGTLNLNKTAGVNAIGSGGVQINSNTTAVLLASHQIADGATVIVNGTLALGTYSETIAMLAGGGAVTTGSGGVLTLSSAADSTFLGIISGAGGLAKAGSGTLTLNGTNTYTGGTAINAGILQVGADRNLGGPTANLTLGGGTLAFSAGFTSERNLTLNSGGGTLDNSGNSVTLTGLISGSGALTKTGTGTVLLTSANSYTGATTISNGILQISNASALGTTGAGTTIHAGGELELSGDGIVLNEAITLHGGSFCNGGGTNTYSGALTLTANSVLDADSTKLIITSGISQSGASYGLTKDGPGAVELRGTNTYTGETHVLAGTLSLSNGAAIVDTGAVILHNVAGTTLELNTSETIGSLSGGGASGGNVSLGSCTLTTGNASDTSFGGVISGSGFLVKAGSGTLTLSGSNTYTGGTTLTAGALSVAASSALGLESNNLTIGGGATLKAGDSFSTSRATTLGGTGGATSGGTFEVATGKTLAYSSSSVISGSGSLIKTGAGALAIGGVDSYTGGTYITAGTLVVNSGTALGPLPTLGTANYAVHISDGATIQLASNSWSTNRKLELVGGTANVDVTAGISIVRNGAIYGDGAMNLMGYGTLIINNNGSNANTYAGVTLIANGVLQVNNTGGSATGAGAVTVMSGGTLSGLTAQGGATGTTGSIAGTVEIQNAAKLLTLSGGTLTLGGLTLDAGSLGTFQLGAPTSTSLVKVTGSNLFTLPGSGTSTINIVNTGAMGTGTYHLFDYTGTAVTDLSTLALANLQSGLFNLSLVNNTVNTSIDLDVSAITQQWKKGGSNTNWSTAGNWWTSVIPNAAGAAAAFIDNNSSGGGTAFAATESVTLDASKTVGTLAFQNTGTAFTLSASSGQTLILDNNGVDASIQVLSAPATANHLISAPLSLLDDVTVDVDAGSHGLILSGVISGDQAVTKTGAGPLTLGGTAANTYGGVTEVAAGTLSLNKTAGVDAIGSGGLQIDSGATVTWLASNQIADAASVTVNGTLDLGVFSETFAGLGGGGAVTLGSGGLLTLNGDTDSTFLGSISGAGGITKAGAGTLTLNGVNAYTGGTALNAGTLQVGEDVNLGGTASNLTFDGGTLAFSGSFTSARNILLNSGGGTLDSRGSGVTLTGVISGTGSLTKDGAGTVALNTANSYTGATVISYGILRIGNAAALGTSGAGTTIHAGGELELNGNGLTLNEALTLNGGSLCNCFGNNTYGGTLTLTNHSTLDADAGMLSITSAIGESGGAFGLIKNGPGTVELKGASTYTGSTTVQAGTLSLFNGAALSNSGAVVLLDVAGATLQLNASETIGSLAGGGSTGGNVVLGSTTLTTGDANDTSFSGVISGSGGFLIKTGTGTMTLSGSNTYTGGTTLSAGALRVANSSALGLESNILTIGGGATLKASDSFSTSRATTLGGAGSGVGGTIEVAAGKTLDYASGSGLSGSGSLIKTGAGTLMLEGTNPFTGGLYIQAGTLAANSQEALGAVPSAGSPLYGLHLYDGATFQTQVGSWSTYRQLELVGNLVGTGGVAKVDVTGSNTHQRDGVISGAGKLVLVGTGTLVLTAANTYTGGTLIGNGALQVANTSGSSATGTGAVTVANGGTLKGSATASSGFITGTVGLQSGGTLSASSGATLTLGGLTLGAGSLGTFQLGALTATSMVAITGSNAFILPSSSTSTLSIVNAGAMGVGTYRLFDYTGTAFTDISTLALADAHSGLFNLSLVNNTGNTSIDLSVTAITQQWKKGGSNTNWGNAANWWAGTVPDGSGANVLFLNNNGTAGFSSAEAVTLDASRTAGTIVFQNTTTAFTLSASSGQTLTLNNNGVNASIQVLSAPAAANHVMSASLILADNLTVDIAAGGFGLDLGGTLSGIDQTLTKTGAGPLTLSGTAANTYSGLTEVADGSLNLNKTAGVNAIGAGGLRIASGATVTLLGSHQIADGATVTVNGTLDLGTHSETIAVLAGGGAVTTGSGGVLTLSSATDATFLGILSGPGSLVKDGSGTLTLNGTNTYTGGTAIHAGTLRVGADHNLGGTGDVTFDSGALLFSGGFTSARNLTLNSGGGTLDTNGNAITVTGVIGGSGALTKNGGGTLTLSGTNTYTGATTLNGGVLGIASNANLGAVATGASLYLNGGGTLRATAGIALDNSGSNSRNIVVGSGGGTLETLTSGHTLTVSGIISGTGNLTAAGAGTLLLTGINTLNGAVTINAGSTLQQGNGGAGGSLSGTSGITNNGALIYNRSGTYLYSNIISGSGSFTKDGSSTLTLAGANTYSGATTISNGTLQIGDGVTDGSISNSSGITNTSALIYNVAVSDSFAQVISGTGTLTKSGAGTLTLSGSNTYTGVTTINGGALSLAADSGLGTAPETATAGRLVLGGGTLAATETFTLDGKRGITTGGALDVAAGKTLTYGGIAAGSGTLTKTGTGTLVLTGTNTYTGATTISSGTLQLGDGTTNGALAANAAITAIGALVYNVASSTTQIAAISLSGGGAVTKSGAGTLVFIGQSSFSGAVTIDAGTLQIGGVVVEGVTYNGSLGNAASITNNGTLVNKNNISASTFSRTLGGTGAFVMDAGSANTLTLSGANTYGGATTVASGTLKLGSSTALGTTATGTTVAPGAVLDLLGQTLGAEALTLSGTGISSGGALINSDGTAASLSGNIALAAHSSVGGVGQMTLSGVISGSDMDLTKVGAGALTLSNTNTYTGTTALSAGTLNITGSLASGSNVTVASGTTLMGTGTIGGSVTVASAGIITAGNGTSGTLTLGGGLTFDGAGSIHIGTLGNYTGTTAKALGVTGALTLNGGAGAVTLALPSGAVDNGTYHLLSYGGTFSNPTGFSFTGAVPNNNTLRQHGELSNDTTNLRIDYVVTGDNPVWSGAHGGIWTTGTTGEVGATPSWATESGHAATDFWLSDNAEFNDTVQIGAVSSAPSTTSVSIDGSVNAGSILFDNSALDYTVTGSTPSDKITGGAVVKTGSGKLTITNANSYSDGTTLNAGVLQVGNDSALGTGILTLNGGTLSSDSTAAHELANNLVIGGDVTLGNATHTGVLTFSGTVDLDGSTHQITAASDVMLTGILSGTNGGLSKAGTGTLTLSGANTFTSDVNLSAGTLAITSSSSLGAPGSMLTFTGTSTLRADAGVSVSRNYVINSGVTATIDTNGHDLTNAGIVTGSGALTKINSGIFTLTGVNTYTGTTTISGGTLRIGDGATDGSIASSAAIINNSALTYNLINSRTFSQVISGSGSFTKEGPGTMTLTGVNTYTGATTISGGTLQIGDGGTDGSIAATSGITNNASLVYNLADSRTFDHIISGSGTLTKTGEGTLTLSGSNTYGGQTSVSGGTLSISSNANLGAVATGATLNLNGGTLQTTANDITLDNSGTNKRGIVLGSGGGAFDTATSNKTLTVTGVISGSGALTKTGAGDLTLTGANTYAGATTVSGGTLGLAADSGLGTAPEAITAGHLVLNSGTLAATNTFELASTRGVQLATTSTLDVAADMTLTYSGVVAGPGGLNKTGTGTLELLGRNQFAGEITHNAGTLVINSGMSLGAYVEGESGGQLVFAGTATLKLAADVNAARSFVFNEGATATIDTDGHTFEQSGVFSGGGALTKTGTGTLTLTGTNANAYSGLTTVKEGELNLNRAPGTLAVSGDLTIGDGTGGANADVVRLQASGQISSTAVVRINGSSGKLDLNGNAQVIGSLADAGTLTANGSSVALGSAGALTVGDATSTTFSGVISGTDGSLTKQGSGTLVLTGSNTYTGATTVDAGILVVNGDQHAATGAVAVSGTLAGTGTLGGATTINSGGTHAPGEVGTVGTQNFSGDLTYADGSIFEWDLNENSTSNMGYDMVGAAGKISVDTSNTTFRIVFGDSVDMNDEFWSTPHVTRQWAMHSIFGKAFFSGAFSTVETRGATVNPLGSFKIDGSYLTYTTVPEPSSVLAGLLLGAGLLRRRRN